MLDAILYHSVCGHTKKYALALSERLNVPAYSLKEAKKKTVKRQFGFIHVLDL